MHSDDVASKFKSLNLDKVSLAEFIRTGKVSPGYSYFKNLKSFDYANILIIDKKKGKLSEKKYFYPEDYIINKYSTINQSLVEMNNSLKKYTKQLKNNYRKISLFLSGGMDSRLIAMYFPGDDIKALSLTTFNNRERKITKKVSKKLKIDLNFLSLEYDQYLKYLNETVLINGGMSDFIENHYYSDNNLKKLCDYDLIISGCYFDLYVQRISVE